MTEQELPTPPTPSTVMPPRRRDLSPASAPAPSWSAFGRVDDDGSVFVRTRTGERLVGQWPSADHAAAVAFYGRRYDGLVIEVDLLERRIRAGALAPDDARSAVATLRATVAEAPVVGDLDSLLDRLDALDAVIAERRAELRAERAAKTARTKGEKERIVAEAEQLATSSDWRAGTDRLRQLVEEWKALPRLDRKSDDELWQRFSAARTTYTRRQRAQLAEQTARREAARVAKEKLVAQAEALSSSTEWGSTSAAYRSLMTQWKAAGAAAKGVDDALWRRFRAAQDAFFAARDAVTSKVDEEQVANAAVKRQLLADAERLLPVTNPSAARAAFRALAERWDRAGKVPRSEVRALEDRFKAVDEKIRTADDERWRRSSPEAQARAAETVQKLEAALQGLRRDLAAAQEAGNARKAAELTAAIEAREAWLDQARRSLSEVGG